MNSFVQTPTKGQPATAAWGAAVAKSVNALAPMSPAGMLTREGATGNGFSPLPVNLRNRKAVDLGCWAIGVGENHEPVILRPYLNVGGVTIEATDLPALEDIVGKLLAAKVRIETTSSSLLPSITATAEVYDDLEDMMSHQKDSPNETIIPIWSLAEEGGMTADYRNMPHIQMTETLAS